MRPVVSSVMLKKINQILRYTFIIILAFWLNACLFGNKSIVTVINQSSQTIISLKIELAGETKTIAMLSNGRSAIVEFNNFSDSHYILNGVLKDGTLIKGEFGYVTNGMNFEETFVINKGGIVKYKQTI